MAELVHLAGPSVEFDGVWRQRCAWCGALIEERELERMAVQTDATASAEVQQEEANRSLRSGWEGLVAVDGNAKWKVEEPVPRRAPERSCMRLLPRVEAA